MPWRSLLGDYSVSGGGLLVFFSGTKRTHRRERVDERHGTGPVSPRVATVQVFPRLLGGKAHVCAKNRRNVMSPPALRLVGAQRITWTMGVQGKVRIPTPRKGQYRWGRPVREIRTPVNMGN
jgi:hypothetical protein